MMASANNDTQTTPAETVDLMGYENTTLEVTLPETSNAVDAQTLINNAIKEVTVDDNGKYVYPDDMDPMLKAAVAASKSFRDNQSGFTKSQQSLKEMEAENTALREQLASTPQSLGLSPADKVALDNLMTTDPVAWRQKLNSLEQEATETRRTAIEATTTKSRAETELQRRIDYLDSINANRESAITPDVLDNDIPPRMTKKLADGEVTFEEYIEEVSSYLDKGRVVANTTAPTTANLNTANGSSVAQAQTQQEGELSYANTTF